MSCNNTRDAPEFFTQESLNDPHVPGDAIQLCYRQPCQLQAPLSLLIQLPREVHSERLILYRVPEGCVDISENFPLLEVIAKQMLAALHDKGLRYGPS